MKLFQTLDIQEFYDQKYYIFQYVQNQKIVFSQLFDSLQNITEKKEILINFMKIFKNIYKDFITAEKNEDFFPFYMFTIMLKNLSNLKCFQTLSLKEFFLDFLLIKLVDYKHFPINVENIVDDILNFGLNEYFTKRKLYKLYLSSILTLMEKNAHNFSQRRISESFLRKLKTLVRNVTNFQNYSIFCKLLKILVAFEKYKINLESMKSSYNEYFPFLKSM